MRISTTPSPLPAKPEDATPDAHPHPHSQPSSCRGLGLGLVTLLLSLAAACSGFAAPKLKLGTLAPVGTSYHKTLMTMGESWRKESNGAVDLNVFAGGKLGGEAEMVGLMKVNSLQAAMLTAVGLSEIEPAVTRTPEHPDGLRQLRRGRLRRREAADRSEERLAKKGFVVLFWSDAGWVRTLQQTRQPPRGSIRKLKLFTWSGNPAQVDLQIGRVQRRPA